MSNLNDQQFERGLRQQKLVGAKGEYCPGSKKTPQGTSRGARKARCPDCGKVVRISGNYGVFALHRS